MKNYLLSEEQLIKLLNAARRSLADEITVNLNDDDDILSYVDVELDFDGQYSITIDEVIEGVLPDDYNNIIK